MYSRKYNRFGPIAGVHPSQIEDEDPTEVVVPIFRQRAQSMSVGIVALLSLSRYFMIMMKYICFPDLDEFNLISLFLMIAALQSILPT